MTDEKQIETLRKNFRQIVGGYCKKIFVNKTYNLYLKFNKMSINKLGCIKSVKNSVKNGFTAEEHFEAAENIKSLFEHADYLKVSYNRKKDGTSEVVHYLSAKISDSVYAHMIATVWKNNGRDEGYIDLYLSKKADREDD